MTRTDTRPHPVVLTCPGCGRSVVVHIPATVSCLRCARTMTPRTPATTEKAAQA